MHTPLSPHSSQLFKFASLQLNSHKKLFLRRKHFGGGAFAPLVPLPPRYASDSGTGFSPNYFGFLCQYNSTSLHHSYQKDERAKPGNLPENIAVCELEQHCIDIHVLPHLSPFKGPIEREIQREMATSDKTKEMNRETENGRTTGWSRKGDCQCKQNTSSLCSVRCYIPHCFVFHVHVLTAKLRVCVCVCVCACVRACARVCRGRRFMASLMISGSHCTCRFFLSLVKTSADSLRS